MMRKTSCERESLPHGVQYGKLEGSNFSGSNDQVRSPKVFSDPFRGFSYGNTDLISGGSPRQAPGKWCQAFGVPCNWLDQGPGPQKPVPRPLPKPSDPHWCRLFGMPCGQETTQVPLPLPSKSEDQDKGVGAMGQRYAPGAMGQRYAPGAMGQRYAPGAMGQRQGLAQSSLSYRYAPGYAPDNWTLRAFSFSGGAGEMEIIYTRISASKGRLVVTDSDGTELWNEEIDLSNVGQKVVDLPSQNKLTLTIDSSGQVTGQISWEQSWGTGFGSIEVSSTGNEKRTNYMASYEASSANPIGLLKITSNGKTEVIEINHQTLTSPKSFPVGSTKEIRVSRIGLRKYGRVLLEIEDKVVTSTIRTPLPIIELIVPKLGEKRVSLRSSVEMRWDVKNLQLSTKEKNQIKYNIYISQDKNNFGKPITTVTGWKSTYLSDQFQRKARTRYYWKVDFVLPNGQRVSSPIGEFITEDYKLRPMTVQNPLNNTTTLRDIYSEFSYLNPADPGDIKLFLALNPKLGSRVPDNFDPDKPLSQYFKFSTGSFVNMIGLSPMGLADYQKYYAPNYSITEAKLISTGKM